MSPPLGADLVDPTEKLEWHLEDSQGAAAETDNPRYMKKSKDGLDNLIQKWIETHRNQPPPPDGPVSRMPLQEGLDHGGFFNPSNKKSVLIKAVIDYVQSVEDKLDGLNSTLGQEKLAKLEKDEGLPKASGPAPGRHMPWVGVRLEAKFNNATACFARTAISDPLAKQKSFPSTVLPIMAYAHHHHQARLPLCPTQVCRIPIISLTLARANLRTSSVSYMIQV